MQHPENMAASHIESFLTYLSIERHVAPATQRTALNALIFMFRKYLNISIEDLDFKYAKPSRRIPVVYSHKEASTVISNLHGQYQLMAELMYGSGLRLMECCRLRIKDVDFELNQLIIRESKGNKHRVTVLPEKVINRLENKIDAVKKIHEYDIDRGYGDVYLPYALARKYPTAAGEFHILGLFF